MKWKIVTINEYNECVTRLVILLEIVMVIPEKHESQSRTNESHFEKHRVQSSKYLDLLCIQTVNLKAETKTFCHIDTDEIPGFFPVTKIWYPVKIQFLSFTCEDITVVMATSIRSQPIGKEHHSISPSVSI